MELNLQNAKSQMLEKFRAEDGHENSEGYDWYLRELFQDVQIEDASILEIGSGRGLLSLYCATQNASRVLSLEPESAGSLSGSCTVQRKRAEQLGLTNLEIQAANFFEYKFGDEKFDVVILNAVLNHLYETPEVASRNTSAAKRYVEILKELRNLLNDDGVLIATDACRYSLWTQLRRLGVPKSFCPFQRTIEWRIHQQPSVWQTLFATAGFESCRVSYPVLYRLRKFAWILRNPLANFMLAGLFVIHARQKRAANAAGQNL